MQKTLFDVTGMTCSACSARIEKTVAKAAGVQDVTVNLLTNSMSVTYDETQTNPDAITKLVDGIGYGAAPKNAEPSADTAAPKKPADTELHSMKTRLITSLVFTIPLFYISMGAMFSWPMPGFLTGMHNTMAWALTQVLLVIPVLFVNRRYFIGGTKSLLQRAPNMDSLIALGSGAAFLYGIYAVYRIAFAVGMGNEDVVHHFSMNLYFESAAMILTLITLGKYFEARAKSRTSEAIAKLMDLTPKTAVLLRGGDEIIVPVEQVVKGDVLVVKAGEGVPVDGIITGGYASIDESAITGESLPAEKVVGNAVIGGTVALTGHFTMQATAVGAQTTLAKIIQLVDEATSSKAPVAKLADKISGIFVPVVMAIAVISTVVWLLLGHSFEFSLSIGIAVLVISCPCALGLATPTAIMVGTGKGAANGILIKSAEALEIMHSIDTVVLDKTGTVTQGKPVVTDFITADDNDNQLLAVAASLEKMSGHPLAAPIIAKAEQTSTPLLPVENYQLLEGRGISGDINGQHCLAGNQKLMEENNVDTSALADTVSALADEGKTPLYFAKNGLLLGIIAVADVVKPTSAQAIAQLKQMGIDVIMLTGDNQRTARAIQNQVGVDKTIAEVMPQDKELEVRKLQQQGKRVAMVGDGINDAPALARADVGVAIGAGTDIAIESADIVLMKSDLLDVASAIQLSRAVMRNIKQNLFWAFLYNTIGIPVAAGLLYAPFGLLLNPMIAAAAMSFSSVSVVANALRLRFFTPVFGKKANNTYHTPAAPTAAAIPAGTHMPHNVPASQPVAAPPASDINNQTTTTQEVPTMTKIIHIEGMSCQHCVAAVTKALNQLPGVTSVAVDLESKTATVVSTGEAANEQALKAAIVEAGYEVVA